MADLPKTPKVEVRNPRYAGATPEMVAKVLMKPVKDRSRPVKDRSRKDSKVASSKATHRAQSSI